MTVVLRADASDHLGHGHIRRCLSLAEGCRSRGIDVVFVCRVLPGGLVETVREAGFACLELPEAAEDSDASATIASLGFAGVHPDWAVVDSYDLDARWESQLRRIGCRIAVIDDLADRRHDCDVLLDVGRAPEDAADYSDYVPATCQVLVGPQYALLRPEFTDAGTGGVRTSVRRILVFFGGADTSGETIAGCRGLSEFAGDCVEVVVVHGADFDGAAELVAEFGSRHGYRIIGPSEEMARLMREADLALGAFGTTTWERCYSGLPCIGCVVAPNQELTARTAERLCIAEAVASGHASEDSYRRAVGEVLSGSRSLREMSEACISVAGMMRPSRRHALVEELLRCGVSQRFILRDVARSDSAMILTWRNHSAVRGLMRSQHVISELEHARWLEKVLLSPLHFAWVFETAQGPTGFVQIAVDPADTRAAEWGLYIEPQSQGRGYGKALALMALDKAFDEMALDFVRAEVIGGNRVSAKLHAGLGFLEDTAATAQSGPQPWILARRRWSAMRGQVAASAFSGCVQ